MTDASELAKEVIAPAKAAIGAYGTAALTRDAETGAEEEAELGREVLQEIYWRAKPVEPFEVAVTGVSADPEDADAVGALRLQVKKALEADEILTAETAKLVQGPKADDASGSEETL
jgi:hypothetical protein